MSEATAAGIDATGLSEDLDIHHLIVNSWEDLEAPQNVRMANCGKEPMCGSCVSQASMLPGCQRTWTFTTS